MSSFPALPSGFYHKVAQREEGEASALGEVMGWPEHGKDVFAGPAPPGKLSLLAGKALSLPGGWRPL